jgi:hypothetical protein
MTKRARTEDDREPGGRFTRDELDELGGEVLPQRAATSLINPHVGLPLTAGLAAGHLPAGEAAAASDAADAEVDPGDAT